MNQLPVGVLLDRLFLYLLRDYTQESRTFAGRVIDERVDMLTVEGHPDPLREAVMSVYRDVVQFRRDET